MAREVYLDYAAATPMSPKVLAAMLPYLTEQFYNPSAPYWPAVKLRRDYQQAKAQIGSLIGAKADQVVITAGATESINLALAGHRRVVISGVEHPAVVQAAKQSATWVVAPVDKQGIIKLDALAELIDDQTDLVSVCLASSELGTVQPLRQIAELIKQKRLERFQRGCQTPLLFHSDACQGLAYLKLNSARTGLDLLTYSAAKLGGPKQVAALWLRPGIKLQPLIVGGGQEMGLRSGTENVAGVMGFAAAVKNLSHAKHQIITDQRDYLAAVLAAELSDIHFLGSTKKRLPNYLVVVLKGVEAERLIYRLEKRGVYVSTGAACAASRGQESLALTSIGLSAAERSSSLRITLGAGLSSKDINYAAQVIIEETNLERKWAL